MSLKKIGIIGAGPAGAWLAFKLAKAGFEVLLFDQKAPWEKPCAGGLADVIWHDCPELEPLKEQGCHNRKVRIITVKNEALAAELSRPLYTVSREKLGQFTIDLACAAGARFHKTRVEKLESKGRGFELQDRAGEIFAVDFLAGAEGISSRVRRMFCEPWSRMDYFYTLSLLWPKPTSLPLTFRFFSGLEGYAWIFPGKESFSLGIGSRGKQFQAGQFFSLFEKALDSDPELAEIKPRLRKQAVSWLIPALRFSTLRQQKVAADNWALIGDASGAAHAVSGGGIPYALKTASLLAEALKAGRPEQYQALWWRLCKDELAGAALWGPLFYRPLIQGMLSGYLLKSGSAKKLVVRLLSGEHPPRREIFSGLAKMLLGF